MYHMAKGNGYALFLIFPTYMYPLGTASFSRKKSESFDEWCSKWNGKTILLSRKSPNKEPLYGYLRTSISSRVSIKSSVFRQNCRISRIVLRGNTTSKLSTITTTTGMRKLAKQKVRTCSTFFGRFLCRHCITNVVKLGNAIVCLIYEIVASSMVIFATSISSETDTHTEAQ